MALPERRSAGRGGGCRAEICSFGQRNKPTALPGHPNMVISLPGSGQGTYVTTA